MAKIIGQIQFGVQVELTSPLAPNETMLKTITAIAEAALTKAILTAVVGTLKLLPGVTASITDAKTKLTIDEVKP